MRHFFFQKQKLQFVIGRHFFLNVSLKPHIQQRLPEKDGVQH